MSRVAVAIVTACVAAALSAAGLSAGSRAGRQLPPQGPPFAVGEEQLTFVDHTRTISVPGSRRGPAP